MQVAGVSAGGAVPARLLTVSTPDQARALARIAATPELTAPQLAVALGLPVAEVDGLVEAYRAALQKLLTAAGFWFPKGATPLEGAGLTGLPTSVLGEQLPGAPPGHRAYAKVADLRPAPGSGQAVPAPIFARIALKVGTGAAAVLLLVDDDGVVTGGPPGGVIPPVLQGGTARGSIVLVEVAATPTGATVPAAPPTPGQYDAGGGAVASGSATVPTPADQGTGSSSVPAAGNPAGSAAGTAAAAGPGQPPPAGAIPVPGAAPVDGAAGAAPGAGAPVPVATPVDGAGGPIPGTGKGPADVAGRAEVGPLPPGLPAPPRNAHPFQVGAPVVEAGNAGAPTTGGAAGAAPAAPTAATAGGVSVPGSVPGSSSAAGVAAAGGSVPPLLAAMTDPVGGYRAWPAPPRWPVPVPPQQMEALARQAAPPVPPVPIVAGQTRPAEVHDLLTRVAQQPLDLVADARSIPAAIDLAVRDPSSVRRLVIDLTALLASVRAGEGVDPPPVPSPTDPGRLRELLAGSMLGKAEVSERRRKGSPAAGPGRRTLAEHFFAALFSIRVAEQIGQVEVPITLLGPESDEAIRDLLDRVAGDLADARAVYTDEPEVIVLEIIRER